MVLWESSSQNDLEKSWQDLNEFHDRITVNWSTSPDWKVVPPLVFVTPAIPPHRLGNWGLNENNTSTEVELALMLAEKKGVIIHAITGSVGKSTTVKLFSEALGVPAVGNIGRSFFEFDEGDWPKEVVMELSSFQIHHLRLLNFTPSSFILTPVYDHHASWHGGIEAYQNCKYDAVSRWEQTVIGIRPDTDLSEARAIFGERPMVLLGEDNRKNLLMVVELLSRLGLWKEDRAKTLSDCRSLDHRLEVVREEKGRRWVNDSKATSPTATMSALKGVNPSCLILDGLWSVDPTPVLKHAEEMGMMIILLGGAHSLEKACLLRSFPLFMGMSLEESLELASMSEGDILYSPGAPSYDRFKNYEERGRAFIEGVRRR